MTRYCDILACVYGPPSRFELPRRSRLTAMVIQLARPKGIWSYGFAFIGLSVILLFLYRGTSTLRDSSPIPFEPHTPPPSATRTPCIGPRGRSVQEDRDDQIWARSLSLRMCTKSELTAVLTIHSFPRTCGWLLRSFGPSLDLQHTRHQIRRIRIS